ncbi:MAG: DnaJ domain-containing protein [Candidatus Limnocylindrales bacterium]
MPRESFRGDPYRVLDLPPDTSDAAIKRRWRALAQEHHPDRAAADPERAAAATRRMARINAAYELLGDPERRRRFDDAHGHQSVATSPGEPRPDASGPPPPRPTRPVTARFDTSLAFHLRNSTISHGGTPLPGQQPSGLRDRDRPAGPAPLRASRPSGPIERRRSRARRAAASLAEARDALLEFGKFRGHTLGQVADFEPTYIDWIARTITRDLDLVLCARVIRADLDARGVVRLTRPITPGFGQPSPGRPRYGEPRPDQPRSADGAA